MLIRSKAPLRLGFAGGGTDIDSYSNKYGGNVLNATIAMFAHCTIEPTNNGKIIFNAIDLGKNAEYKSAAHLELDGNFDLFKGIYNRIVRDYSKKPLSFTMTTFSEAVRGSGLGGSSTMVVAIIQALITWLRIPLGEYEIASLAYEIERVDVGLSGGKQDQFATTFGGFNFMEFHKDNKVIINPLRISEESIDELQANLVLYFTGVSRDSALIIDDQKQLAFTRNNRKLTAMHGLKDSCIHMKNALLLGEIDAFSEIMNQSWLEKKNTSDLVSTPAIDRAFDIAMTSGASAGKVNGAGGGGYIMFLVDPVKRIDVCRSLESLGGKSSLVNFYNHGVKSWRVK